VLALCARAGLVRLGLIALDGTKIAASASLAASRTADALEAEIRRILADAAAVDAAEDAALGPDRRGDELPPELAERGTRLARLREARRQIDADQAEREARYRERVAEREAADPAARARIRPPTRPTARLRRGNATDPDSRAMKTHSAYVQGYNGQLVATADGIAIAAEVSQEPTDPTLLAPMLAATTENLAAAAVTEPIGTLLADGGYWSEVTVAHLPADHPPLLIPPRVGRPQSRPGLRWPLPERDAMLRRFEDETVQATYRRRATIIEPLFGQLKEIRRTRRFQRRGLAACRSEWKLLWATHNLLKLWRSGRRGSPIAFSI
jgi:DDE family transposase